MAAVEHTIAGTVLSMPVRVRKADVHTAMFAVPAGAAQRMIDYSGLRVCPFLPGRAIVTLVLARYLDGDLGRYNEFGACVMVNPPGSRRWGPAALADAAAFVHRLPVDQAFTLEAGRTIWGFPKTMADFTIAEKPLRCAVSAGGSLIAAMEFRRGLPIPSPRPRPQVLKTYTHAEGAVREVPWEMTTSTVRARPGGALLRLGDHPFARELAALGLPRRALASGSAADMAMAFGDATVLG